MGIVITWSLVFWVIAGVIAFCALSFFLLQVAYAIAPDEKAPDVSIRPRMPSPDDETVDSEATEEAFRKEIPKFGRRHSPPLDPPAPQSFFHQYRLEGVAERWKQNGAAALNKVALLHKSHGLQHRLSNELKTLRKLIARSGSLIFVKSGGFFRRLARGQAFLGRRLKAKEALLFITELLIGQYRKVWRFFFRRPDQQTADELADRAN
jgi:hypothetical protein